jgi:hypothetical protein
MTGNKLIYTGIGSRETPQEVLNAMYYLAQHLRSMGFILRSGGAGGADSAFEAGASPRMEIYIPWNGFSGRKQDGISTIVPILDFEMARHFHPAWDRLNIGGQKLQARNCNQIFGANTKQPIPTNFVICWTKGGAPTGGTGQAIRIANHYSIPVYNLANTHPDVILQMAQGLIRR